MNYAKRKIEHLTDEEVEYRLRRLAKSRPIKENAKLYLSMIPEVLKDIGINLTPCPVCGAPTINLKKYRCKYCKHNEYQ